MTLRQAVFEKMKKTNSTTKDYGVIILQSGREFGKLKSGLLASNMKRKVALLCKEI